MSRPSTRLGWWSVGLAGCLVGILLIVSIWMIGYRNSDLKQPGMALYVSFLMLLGLGAVITGLAAVIRHSERSWLVWLSCMLGLFMFSLVLFEFLVPH